METLRDCVPYGKAIPCLRASMALIPAQVYVFPGMNARDRCRSAKTKADYKAILPESVRPSLQTHRNNLRAAPGALSLAQVFIPRLWLPGTSMDSKASATGPDRQGRLHHGRQATGFSSTGRRRARSALSEFPTGWLPKKRLTPADTREQVSTGSDRG